MGSLGLLAQAAGRNLLELPQTLASLRATNVHVSPELRFEHESLGALPLGVNRVHGRINNR